ncbi:MAG: STAS domain-containing protein [Planctomycetota bacterium]|nr:STAS domain-containing protein [Planctomycetota bacterium]
MEIQEQRQGAVLVLKPVGPLVQADAEQFAARLQEAMAGTLGRCVFDASAVPFLDSRGVETLVDITESLGQSGRSLKLCAAGETFRQALELTGWGDAFEYFADAHSGVRSFL